MKTIRCVALVAFTQFVAHYGQVHGNPDADDAREVDVPVDLVDQLVAEGKIAAPDDTVAEPRRVIGEFGDFTMTHQGFGRYLVEGPGIAPDTIVKGKADAETMIEALRAHVADRDPQPEPVLTAESAAADATQAVAVASEGVAPATESVSDASEAAPTPTTADEAPVE